MVCHDSEEPDFHLIATLSKFLNSFGTLTSPSDEGPEQSAPFWRHNKKLVMSNKSVLLQKLKVAANVRQKS